MVNIYLLFLLCIIGGNDRISLLIEAYMGGKKNEEMDCLFIDCTIDLYHRMR